MREYNEKELLKLKGLSSSVKYGADLMVRHPKKFDFYLISYSAASMKAEDVKKIADKIDWWSFFDGPYGERFLNENLDFIIDNYEEIGTYVIFQGGILTEDHLEKLCRTKNGRKIMESNKGYLRPKEPSLEIIKKYSEYLNWSFIPNSYTPIKKQLHIVNLDFAREYKDKISWHSFTELYLMENTLTEDSLIEFLDKWNLDFILRNHDLTDSMLDIIIRSVRFKDGYWDLISRYQEFSEEFFVQNLFNIRFNALLNNEKMMYKEFLEVEMKNKTIDLLLRLNNISIIPSFKK